MEGIVSGVLETASPAVEALFLVMAAGSSVVDVVARSAAADEESVAVGFWASVAEWVCCSDEEEVDGPVGDARGTGEVRAGTGGVVVDEADVAAAREILTGSGVELTRVKWLIWAGGGGPVVVGEWLSDRVRLTVCRPGDVLPLPLALGLTPALWWPSRESRWFCV